MELHCSIKVVRAGEKGNTAAAAASYISCDKTIGYDGKVNDYRNKPGFIAGDILLPDEAPQRWREDPSTIWAEQDYLDYEKSTRRGPKSELYRAGDIGLPWDLTDEQCVGIMDEVGELLRQKGMVVQWAIHDVMEDGVRNRHGHIMMSMRSCSSEGFGNKNRAWNKYNGGLNIPEYLRPKVAEILNRELEIAGSDERVEYKSFAERDVDRIPQKHVGTAATAMERKGKKTDRGDNKRYIDWLNGIHAENLQEIEQKTQRLDILIGAAENTRTGTTAYKDWDALFAMLRDVRRSKAAVAGELRRLDKIIAAYENGDTKYLYGIGCNPDVPTHELTVKYMRDEMRARATELGFAESLILTNKDLLKAHNRVVYTSNKVAWDEYRLKRNQSSVAYLSQRMDRLEQYIQYLQRSIGLIDILFNTEAYKDYCATMADLERQRRELRAQYDRTRAELKQGKKDIKEHKKEAREAAREEKKVKRRNDRNDR